jgi:hypothetical protein
MLYKQRRQRADDQEARVAKRVGLEPVAAKIGVAGRGQAVNDKIAIDRISERKPTRLNGNVVTARQTGPAALS